MGGGLMQLVAYGAQDIYLTGNPQITFFKVVYRRHTNFAMESIEQTFNGAVDFGKRVTATISRNGDLIKDMWLEIEFTQNDSLANAVYGLGNALVKLVEIEIGGQLIDRQYGEWLDIWSELSVPEGKRVGYDTMVGNVPNTILDQDPDGPDTDSATWTAKTCRIYTKSKLDVPLMFWFNRNPGLALPLIALQYHEVKINLDIETARNLRRGVTAGTALAFAGTRLKLWVDYIYLDTDERRRFAQVSHEYLIEQLQFTGDESVTSASNKIKLNFNHPVKEIVWVVQPDSNVDRVATLAVGGPQWFNYTDRVDETYFSGTPQDPLGGGMGGASALVGNFPYSLPFAGGLNTTSPDPASGLSAFTNVANSGDGSTAAGTSAGYTADTLDFGNLLNDGTGIKAWGSDLRFFDKGQNPVSVAKLQLNGHDRFAEREGRYFNLVQPFQHHENVPATGINVYSFALKPEEHQPSGTCNFSRIDNATLHLTLTPQSVKRNRACKVRIYAINYNVLRIMSGMGGLAYSN